MINMETNSDTASTNGDLENRRLKQEINDNDLDLSTMKLKQRRPRYSDQYDLETMKSNIHDKGSQLSTVWNELYNLLENYQAKLFTKEGEFLASKAKYEGVSDMEQLRNDLICKDNEVKELKERLCMMESRSETVQLDLSVKNSLLKKYQQDLLDKEAALLNLQSTNKKLENRVQALEVKLAGVAVSTVGTPQPSTSGIVRQSTPPQLKRRGLPSQHSVTKRRPLAPAGQTTPVVCLETEENDESRDHHQALSDSINAPLFADQWTEHDDEDEENSNSNSNQQNVFPGEENDESAAHRQLLEANTADDGSLMIDSPASKLSFGQNWRPAADRRFECRYCSRKFSQAGNRHRHEQTVHEKILPFRCDICDKFFGQKVNLRIHMARHHARMQAAADARALMCTGTSNDGLEYSKDDAIDYHNITNKTAGVEMDGVGEQPLNGGNDLGGTTSRLVDRLMCQLCHKSLSEHAAECPLRI